MSPAEFDTSECSSGQIFIIKTDCQYFIQDGHHQVALALKNNQNLIAAQISEAVSPQPDPKILDLWESYFNFKFVTAPSL